MLTYESKYPRRAIASHDNIFKFNTVFFISTFYESNFTCTFTSKIQL